jgi:hypothetical protein
MSPGISDANDEDHAALAQGMMIYDAFYSWIRDPSAEQHNWPSAAVNQ